MHQFRYTYTEQLAPLLDEWGATVFLTTYQSGRLVVIRSHEGKLSILLRQFDRPMGLAVSDRRLTIATKNQIWFLRNARDLASLRASRQRPLDAYFVPRNSHVTGDVACHEIAWADDELWLVNTRFSCLSTLHPDYSFVPAWRPDFITKLAADDRCHLNGLEMHAGRPAYVTALAATDERHGWRKEKNRGGCVIHVPSHARVANGLCMPHSPRLHEDKLWVLNSGVGELCQVSLESGELTPVAQFDGYARGLAFHQQWAFVGLSKARDSNLYGGIPLTATSKELHCGLRVVNWKTGVVEAALDFDSGIEEIFDVRILPGIKFPTVVGLKKDTVDSVFVTPRPESPT